MGAAGFIVSVQCFLSVLKQGDVQLNDTVVFVADKILHDNIGFTAAGQCITGTSNKILCLFVRKLQSYSKAMAVCFVGL